MKLNSRQRRLVVIVDKSNSLALLTISVRKENGMRKQVILMIVIMLMIIPSVVMADYEDEKAGRLFLYQKCDGTLANQTFDNVAYDASGCPLPGQGPWPVLNDKTRSGRLEYSLWGDKFRFSFSGHGLMPATKYTLIYYADPWPGNRGLICLGSGQSTPDKAKGKGKWKWGQKGGNLEIHGEADIKTSLPVPTDGNYNPVPPNSGAVGAKIWLVLSDDVQCEPTSQITTPQMVKWNPVSYLFEYNMIVFEYRPGDNEE